MHSPFLAKCIIVDVLPLFLFFTCNSSLPPEIGFLKFCRAFRSSWQPYFNKFLDDSCHL